ncbi:MAG: ribonuclease E activity regulator RraA [Dermatophilus congolensis]|nr:ribonuclease E activity regulator RraA [Dermatophilus congolensis]
MTFSTPDLCDAHPEVRVAEPVFRSYGGREAFGGPAVTVRCVDGDGPDNTLVKELANTPGEGRVLVVDVAGVFTNAVLGDLIAAEAAKNGWAGMVINGAVRDVEVLRDIDLGVCALASIPRRSDRRGVGERDIAVEFAGVTFAPGDHVYADATGVLVSSDPLI